MPECMEHNTSHNSEALEARNSKMEMTLIQSCT